MSIKLLVRVPVELSTSEAEEVFDAMLVHASGGKDCFIGDDGKIYETNDFGHGSPTNEEVQNPSDVQRLALQLRDAIAQQRKARRRD